MEFTVTIHQQLLQQAMKETGIRDASKLMTHALKSRVLRGAHIASLMRVEAIRRQRLPGEVESRS